MQQAEFQVSDDDAQIWAESIIMNTVNEILLRIAGKQAEVDGKSQIFETFNLDSPDDFEILRGKI